MAGIWPGLWRALGRKQVFHDDELEVTSLKRCLNTWDLTALGLGGSLGVGVYVLLGSVALHHAGPSVLISFVIAAVAALLSALCYAEFGSRVPRAGSAYIYTYVAIGEFAAFLVGWNMILEGVFGTASLARGLSMYADSILGGSMSEFFVSVAPITIPYMTTYFDFFSFLAVIILGVLLCVGVREAAAVNNVLCIINVIVLLFIVIAGAIKADASNWSIPEEQVPPGFGTGGLFPYGVWGTLRGAAICYYGFVGFDIINAAGEEVRQPRRAIPKSILIVLLVVFLMYASISTVVTMMVPYYLQGSRLASVAAAFTYVDMDWARWIVSIGAIFAITASLFGAMFPLPRLLYAMSSDGLLFHWFAKVNANRQTPLVATALPAAVIAVVASILELEQLIMMTCIGTLLSYTVVAICVLLLRYKSQRTSIMTSTGYTKQIFGFGDKVPTDVSSRVVHIMLIVFICLCVAMSAVTVYAEAPIIPASILHGVAVLLLIIIMLQPQRKEELYFKTPLIPIIPCLSIYVNIHLMLLINWQTWIRVLIWIAIGVLIYLLCLVCYKQKSKGNLANNIKTLAHEDKNGKPPVQIVIESPTPPDTVTRTSNLEEHPTEIEMNKIEHEEISVNNNTLKEEVIIKQAVIENNEEKEAKIIDLLDQVLQAEEDSYGELISLKMEPVEENNHEGLTQRKSLSELSDAGSDASFGIQILSKYDVVAQVHREDMPKVDEEEEKHYQETNDNEHEVETEGHEQVTAFNESDSNSQTDESGYFDTLDRPVLNESTDDLKELQNEETTKETEEEPAPYIPPPPPLDENYFNSPNFKKSYTSTFPKRQKSIEEENKPRDSVDSKSSIGADDNIEFGSNRQMTFMAKLNNLLQSRPDERDESRKRSQSTGNAVNDVKLSINIERPVAFLNLHKELLSRDQSQNLKPVNNEEAVSSDDSSNGDKEEEKEQVEDISMSRNDLKSKLETIFAAGGPQLIKPRLMKSNPPTPEESYQTDTSSTESIAKLPKVDKNDTLGRQKAKFGDVLNSFRLSFNKDDLV